MTHIATPSEPNDLCELAPRVLLAVTCDDVRRSVSTTLRRDGFCVSAPRTATAALAEIDIFSPDVVIVDTHIDLRQHTSADHYVLCIADSNDHETRAGALCDGADDAISQPVHDVELIARCRALLRRPRTVRSTDDLVDAQTLRFDPLVVDPALHTLHVDGVEVPATRIEFGLLRQLCLRPTEVSTRSELLDAVWGTDWGGDLHIVDVHLSNLRRKLDQVTDVKVIHTVRGVGFRLSNEVTRHLRSETTDERRLISV